MDTVKRKIPNNLPKIELWPYRRHNGVLTRKSHIPKLKVLRPKPILAWDGDQNGPSHKEMINAKKKKKIRTSLIYT